MGRTWWCSCGLAIPWAWDVNSEHNSQHIIDWYSFSHVLHGFIFYWFLRPHGPLAKLCARAKVKLPDALLSRLLIAALIESAWELAENSPLIIERYRSATIALNYYGDSIVNSLSDLSMCSLGFLLAFRLPVRIIVALAILFELFTLYMIRDNLTLNVIMLLYPVEAIKNWQSLVSLGPR